MTEATRRPTCALYIRVSTKMQVERGESIDAQRFELTRHAEAHGMRVLAEYVDAEVLTFVGLASRSDAFADALRAQIAEETDEDGLREEESRLEAERAANDRRMRALMARIDALDPADRSYARKSDDMQGRLDAMYDRDAGLVESLDAVRARLAAARAGARTPPAGSSRSSTASRASWRRATGRRATTSCTGP